MTESMPYSSNKQINNVARRMEHFLRSKYLNDNRLKLLKSFLNNYFRDFYNEHRQKRGLLLCIEILCLLSSWFTSLFLLDARKSFDQGNRMLRTTVVPSLKGQDKTSQVNLRPLRKMTLRCLTGILTGQTLVYAARSTVLFNVLRNKWPWNYTIANKIIDRTLNIFNKLKIITLKLYKNVKRVLKQEWSARAYESSENQ